MARTLRWDRGWNHNINNTVGDTGEVFDVARAPFVPGETLTRLHWSFQIIYDRPGDGIGAWRNFGAFGVIEAPANDPNPPGRPMDDPDLDWLAWEPLVWTHGDISFDLNAGTAIHVNQASRVGLDVKAQRKADPAFGSVLWFMVQHFPGIVADTEMVRALWFSAGFLEPA